MGKLIELTKVRFTPTETIKIPITVDVSTITSFYCEGVYDDTKVRFSDESEIAVAESYEEVRRKVFGGSPKQEAESEIEEPDFILVKNDDDVDVEFIRVSSINMIVVSELDGIVNIYYEPRSSKKCTNWNSVRARIENDEKFFTVKGFVSGDDVYYSVLKTYVNADNVATFSNAIIFFKDGKKLEYTDDIQNVINNFRVL